VVPSFTTRGVVQEYVETIYTPAIEKSGDTLNR